MKRREAMALLHANINHRAAMRRAGTLDRSNPYSAKIGALLAGYGPSVPDPARLIRPATL